jgi:ADP-ribosylation factor GTPase-activating protein 1
LSGSTPALDQKTANENYFASLGQANALRPDNLPPSQGGKYQGFGSTPSPQESSQNASFALSSKAAPTLGELQENPMAALSKGWGLFSAAVAGASRVVNESVIQPGLERARDPELHATVRGYANEAQRRAGYLGQSANDWSRQTLGIDVAEQVGGIVGGVRDRVGPGGSGGAPQGYSSLSQHYDGESGALYHDDEEDEEDFFDAHTAPSGGASTTTGSSSVQRQPASSSSSAKPTAAKNDDWDNEWQDF